MAAYRSLREFIERLEAEGELVRVSEPVSTVLEMTEIQTRLLATGGDPLVGRVFVPWTGKLTETVRAIFEHLGATSTHPHDPARPSVTDIKIATDYEEYWGKINLPVPAYLIVSLMNQAAPDLRTYWIRGGTIRPADVHIL